MRQQWIGLLSGTSMDAIDCGVFHFDPSGVQLIAQHSHPIPRTLVESLLKISQFGRCELAQLGQLDVQLGALFADAVLTILHEQHIPAESITAIGSHGQTIAHCPKTPHPFSMQIGDPNIIAHRTGIPTVGYFRQRDMAVGGQGAPLAPAFHNAVFRSHHENRVLVNIGGIANITVLPADLKAPIIGFDTGPGNCLMDMWTLLHWNRAFDNKGEQALRGQIHPDLLQACLSDPYFTQSPPKSTGRDTFNSQWLASKMPGTLSLHDVQATLLTLTAKTITESLKQYAPAHSQVFVCGGGAHNAALMNALSRELKQSVRTTESLGIHPDWVEAGLFAWLAKQTFEGKTGNLPEVTGAQGAVVLGGVFGLKA